MLISIVILFFSFFLANPAKAIEEFTVSQKIDYTINVAGDAQVYQEVELTNNLSEIYPKEYQISLSGPAIENVKGTDEQGSIIQNTEKTNDTTTIFLKFNQTNVGKGKITKFKLNYTIPNLATHKGKVWEVPLPEHKGVKNTDKIDIYLHTPDNFGTLSFSSTPPLHSYSLNNQNHIEFTQTDSKSKNLFIFGNYQLFDFDFKYFLDNPTDKPTTNEIAIPPETGGQQIIYKNINPQPRNVRIDKDGNWIAQYLVPPQDSIEISVSGQAKIISSKSSDKTVNISELTQSNKFWPSNNSTIVEISQNLSTPKNIYDYVISTLDYGYNSLNTAVRKGAVEALLDPKNSLCTEFTDLFVTLARARGIPAREIEGFAYTNNPKIKPINQNADILHAWPQYYDSLEQQWISIDPTWAKTTNGIDYFNDLDLNHFIFVIHGHDSQSPPPPGSYKKNRNIKTVKVEFATTEIKEQNLPPVLTVSKTEFNKKPEIIVNNPNINIINNVTITLKNNGWQHHLPNLPPHSSIKVSSPHIGFFQSLFPKNSKLSFDITSSDGSSTSVSTPYPQHYVNLIIIVAALILLLGISGIILSVRTKKT